jgi:glycosyltransferase involved in cell wall biosynthesis
MKHGLSDAVERLIKMIFRRVLGVGKIKIFERYSFTDHPEIVTSIRSEKLKRKTINWFIPEIGKGSGGHQNIFRFIKHLEELGFECRLIVVGNTVSQSPLEIKRNIEKWFYPLRAEVYTDARHAPSAFFSMASSWQTAYYVRAYCSSVHRCYFIQDYEPWFYPAGSDAMLAEATYHFGFHRFTAGSWLANKLNNISAIKAVELGFSVDHDLFKPESVEIKSKKKRILFYARPPTPRRAFELGLLVLKEVAKSLPDAKFILAGWDLRDFDLPKAFENAGQLSLDELPKLYCSCDVALVISCTNLSLLPLELMACGVPVVSNRAPYTEWLLNDTNAILAPASVEGLSSAIVEFYKHPELGTRLRKQGIAFAAQTSWRREAEKMAGRLIEISNQPLSTP